MYDSARLPAVSTSDYIDNISNTQIGNRRGDGQTASNEITRDGQLHREFEVSELLHQMKVFTYIGKIRGHHSDHLVCDGNQHSRNPFMGTKGDFNIVTYFESVLGPLQMELYIV